MNQHATTSSSESTLNAVRAQQALDETRRELKDYLMGAPVSAKAAKAGNASNTDSGVGTSRAGQLRSGSTNRSANNIDWMGLVKAGAATWWREHPLHLGATVLKPVVTDYVRRKPAATLALAAAAGAAFVLVRPWRIASITAFGMSLVRSSNLPVMAASLVATVAENLKKDQT